MLMTKPMFFKRVKELIKGDNSFFNVVCQIINDFELDGSEVGEWIKEDRTIMDHITSEFGIKCNINDLF